jgi:hypothetical protein
MKFEENVRLDRNNVLNNYAKLSIGAPPLLDRNRSFSMLTTKMKSKEKTKSTTCGPVCFEPASKLKTIS